MLRSERGKWTLLPRNLPFIRSFKFLSRTSCCYVPFNLAARGDDIVEMTSAIRPE